MNTLSTLYALGFVACFIWGFYTELVDGRRRGAFHDLGMATGITFWAVIWPVTIALSIAIALSITHSDRKGRK